MNNLRVLVESGDASSSWAFVLAIVVAMGLAGWYYDRKHGHRYSRALRGKIGEWVQRAR